MSEDNLLLNLFDSNKSNAEGRKLHEDEGFNKSSSIRSTSSNDESKTVHHKKKFSKEAGQLDKFSSLFKSNPDIKSIDQKDVNVVSEKLFSDDKFSSTELHPYMVSNLLQLGYEKMTSVQKESMPHILNGSDVLIKSQTGSGKTLAYSVPLLESLQKVVPPISRCDGTYAIVILPTRELTLQTYNSFIQLVKPFQRIVPGYLTGGEKKKSEKARIRKGINILVSTPGRLLDHMGSTATLTLNKVKYIVIDEADRLLELGFERDIAKIISIVKERGPSLIQTILLSATLSSDVEKLSSVSLNQHICVDLCSKETNSELNSIERDNFSLPASLQHFYVLLPFKLRLVTLSAFILWKCKYSTKKSKMIIFFSTQHSVEFHYSILKDILGSTYDDLHFFKLYGDMNQKERTLVFEEFCSHKYGILLCTDVAARGLDMPHVRWIVQFNTPGTPADYIHRVGRTARIGDKGHAVIFLQPSEAEYIKVLNDSNISFQEITLDTILPSLLLNESSDISQKKALDHFVKEKATSLQKLFESSVLEDKERRTLARKAYQSFIRSYCTYPSYLKHIFNVKSLHLGHVAKSFGLQDCPTSIGNIVSKFSKLDNKASKKANNKEFVKSKNELSRKRAKSSSNEFSSGLNKRRKT